MVSDVFARIQIHLFAILVCLVMLVETHHHRDSNQYSFRLFRAQLVACMLLLATEAASWSTAGSLKFFWNTICFSLHAVPGYFFSLYADYQMGKSKEQLDQTRWIRLLPLLAAEGLVVLNLFQPVLFSVGADGFYRREAWFLADTLLSYSYLGYTFVRILRGRNELDPLLFRPLMLFHVIPFIGGAVQYLFYGSGFTLPSFALALLVCYVYIQNRQLGTDYLTQACNRFQADKELKRRLQNPFRRPFSLIMIDINNFKKINDLFGHVVGDEALIQTVQTLRRSLRNSDLLARYGGDEFLIITDSHTPEALQTMIARIRHQFAQFNQQTANPFRLTLSIGYSTYDFRTKLTPDELLALADASMYRDKQLMSENGFFSG